MEKLLLSCDTGIDDALAIGYAVGQKDMELLGVCASFGTCRVQNAYRNSRYVLGLFGSGAPVYMGSAKPLVRPALGHEEGDSFFHGAEGLGGVLPQATDGDTAGAKPGDGANAIVEAAHRYGKQLVLVTTGPLTDLAHALQKEPKLPDLLGRVVSMGGALAAPGNATPYAEANILMDPEAAKLVLESRLPLTLVGLDVTRKTLFCNEDLQRWQAIGTKAAGVLGRSMAHYLGAYAKRYPYLAGCALHDPLAVGAALHPEWLTTVPMHLTCVTDCESEADGRTMEDVSRAGSGEYTTLGAFFVDAKAFEKDFYNTVEAGLAKKEEET